MCGIEEARWLERAAASSAPVPPHSRHASKVGFGRALARRLKEAGSASAARHTPPEGMLVALVGVWFESEQFIVSVAHALALAAVIRHTSDSEAYAISRFVVGEPPCDQVPRLLAEAGVYSVLPHDEAVHLAEWCRGNISTAFDEEVADMHGADAVPQYRSGASTIATVLASVRTHDCDLCCMRTLGPGASSGDHAATR